MEWWAHLMYIIVMVMFYAAGHFFGYHRGYHKGLDDGKFVQKHLDDMKWWGTNDHID